MNDDEIIQSPVVTTVKYGSAVDLEPDIIFVVEASLKQKNGSSFHTKLEKSLKSAGLGVVVQEIGENVFLCCTATEERLRKEAVRVKYLMPLAPDTVMKTAKIKIVPSINEDPKYSEMTPYDHIYAPYVTEEHTLGLYQLSGTFKDGEKQLFSSRHKSELIMSIVAGPKPDGARLQIEKLLHDRKITTIFALHDQNDLQILRQKVKSSCAFCTISGFPIEDFRNYFGEKIVFYIAFVVFYTNYFLLPLGLLGLMLYFGAVMMYDVTGESIAETTSGIVIESDVIMAGLIVIFAVAFTEFWRRNQTVLSKKWGTTDSDHDQPDRPEFASRIETIVSFVDGSSMKYDLPWTRSFRFTVSTFVTALMASISVALVAGIFYLRWYITVKNSVYYDGIAMGTYAAAIASALQVQIMTSIWGKVSRRLNNYENHRTDADYESNWVLKKYIFSFINSYASMFYIAFIETAIGDPCSNYGYESCIDLLGVQLIFLVGSMMALSMCRTALHLCCDRETENKSPIEAQYELGEYDYLTGLHDYGEVVLQYGYCVLFGASSPPVFLLAYVNNWIDIQFYNLKLCTQTRRPIAHKAESIGEWIFIIHQLNKIAFITNSALVIFDSKMLVHYSEVFKLVVLLVVPYSLLCIKASIDFLIDDVPNQVRIQLKRERFIVSRLIMNQQGYVDDSSDDDTPR